MAELDPQRLFSALILAIMVLFLASGRAAEPWRRRLRAVSIAAFATAVAVAIYEIGRWWTGVR